jgi:hypothetical protein
MVEVDRQKSLSRVRLREQRVRLLEVNHERLIDKQRRSNTDEIEGRFEMTRVGQTNAHQIGTFPLDHLDGVRVRASANIALERSGRRLIDLDPLIGGRRRSGLFLALADRTQGLTGGGGDTRQSALGASADAGWSMPAALLAGPHKTRLAE